MNTPTNKHTVEYLPPEAVTFDAMSFGSYGPRGFNPAGDAGGMLDVPIVHLTNGSWLHAAKDNQSTVFRLRDSAGRLVGSFFKPSIGFWRGELAFVAEPWFKPMVPESVR